MDFSFITEEDFNTFAARYPDAFSFLLRSALAGEREHLRKVARPNDWQRARLAELNQLDLA